MNSRCVIFLMILGLPAALVAQADTSGAIQEASGHVAVGQREFPFLIKFGSRLQDATGKALVGVNGITFALYAEEDSDTPIWSETQNAVLDVQGRFTVLLGSASPNGIPAEIFASREAHWLGIRTDDGFERPRVLLASVPYAMEAADAQTLGGKSADQFLSVDQFQSYARALNTGAPGCISMQQGLPCRAVLPGFPVTTGSRFEATAPVGPSFVSDATSGEPFQVASTALVTNLNADLLHGLGPGDFAQANEPNQFLMPQIFNAGVLLEGPAPSGTTGQVSPPLDLKDRAFNAGTSTFQDRLFRWQAEPASSTQSLDRLSLLFGAATAAPSETGLSFNSDGTINFVPTQQFPVSSITTAATGFTNSNSYQWSQTTTSGPIVAGTNTISLAQCPPGVSGSNSSLYVYISGSGTPEAVQVTGGTCQGNGQPGTLQFVAANPHPAGYSISSASSGIQEALSASSAATHSGNIVIPPGEYAVHGPISILMSNVTIDFSGSTIDCYVSQTCIFIGSSAFANGVTNVTLINPRGKPMVPYGSSAFLEDNGQGTTLQNVASASPTQPNTFGTYVQVDNDQAFTLNGLSALGGGVRCDATFCGAWVTAPGPFGTDSAVGWLSNLDLSLQCDASGVDWQSGNGLKITNSVIQGWSEFAVRVGHKRGGSGGFVSDNVYYEDASSCIPYNPMGNVGLAGIINQGGQVIISGTAANGVPAVFPNWGASSGTQEWLYWVVPVHPVYGDAVPLPAGYAWTNGSGPITGTFPRVAGASSYKILKMVTNGTTGAPYPEGTGNYLLTIIQQSSCAAQSCQFTDNGQALSSYSNVGEIFSINIYLPLLDFWPGAVIMGQAQDLSSSNYGPILTPELTADVLGEGAIVSTLPANVITGQAQTLIQTAVAVPAAAGLSGQNTGSTALPGASIFKAFISSYVPSSGFKGRLNFGDQGSPGGFSPLITLGDSNWGKTWATGNERPPADVGDLDIGYEGTINTYYQRANTELRNYVGKFPDGSPQESLTGAAKTFNVPVIINGNLTVTGTCTGCGSVAQQASNSNNLVQNGELENKSSAFETETVQNEFPGSNRASQIEMTSAVSPTQLCTVLTCEPGLHVLKYYLDSTSSCSSPGSAAVSLTVMWTDETSTKSFELPLSGTGVKDGEFLPLGSGSNFGSGEFSFWSAEGTDISYTTSYLGCASGIGTYSLHLELLQ
jgi:hypothetical protein